MAISDEPKKWVTILIYLILLYIFRQEHPLLHNSKWDFAACVYASNADQLCDVYVFVQAMKKWDDPRKLVHGAYILGWIDRERYNDCFYQVKKGDLDGDYVEPADAYKIRLGDLRPIGELK